MPCCPHSDARLRPSWMTPALEALYTLRRGVSSRQPPATYSTTPDLRADEPPVRHSATHTGNQHETALLLEPHHLPRHGLCRQQDAGHVDG